VLNQPQIGSNDLDALVQPDVILPVQLHAEVYALGDPERRLRLAVLEDAIRYFQRYKDATGDRERALYEDAVDWLTSRDRSEPFAFDNVCDALELDPEFVRRGLFRWQATQEWGGRLCVRRGGAGGVQPRVPRAAASRRSAA
jgi:hypothetical protein